MGSKRKIHSNIAQDDCNKKAKTQRYVEAASDDVAARSRMNLLENTIRDIVNSSQSVQICATGADTDVMKAIAELDRAFRGRCTTLPAVLPAVPDTPEPKALLETDQTVSIGDMNARGNLPTLPSVDPLLEKAAFTHPGVSSSPESTYDRLEILGDAYIELMATKLIWNKFRDLPSGRISQIRESLVKNETLSEFATRYGFDSRASIPRDYLGQPKRMMKTEGDIFEAYVAAVILSDPENGYSVAEKWLTALWTPYLDTIEDQTICLHAKEALAKKIMGRGIKLKYVDERPPISHRGGKQTFFTGVYLTGWGWTNQHLGSGKGLNKVISGNQAAAQALLNEQLISEIVAVKRASEAERRGSSSQN